MNHVEREEHARAYAEKIFSALTSLGRAIGEEIAGESSMSDPVAANSTDPELLFLEMIHEKLADASAMVSSLEKRCTLSETQQIDALREFQHCQTKNAHLSEQLRNANGRVQELTKERLLLEHKLRLYEKKVTEIRNTVQERRNCYD